MRKRAPFTDKLFYLVQPAFQKASSDVYFTMVLVEPDEDDLEVEVNAPIVIKSLSPVDYEKGNSENVLGINICTTLSYEITTPNQIRESDLIHCVATNIDLKELLEMSEMDSFNDVPILVARYTPLQYSLQELNEQYSDQR